MVNPAIKMAEAGMYEFDFFDARRHFIIHSPVQNTTVSVVYCLIVRRINEWRQK